MRRNPAPAIPSLRTRLRGLEPAALLQMLASGSFVLICATTAAVAGPNGGGTLVLGEIPRLAPTCGDACDPFWADCFAVPQSCEDLRAQGNPLDPIVTIGVFATFDESVVPRLAQVAFGCDYEPSRFFFVSGGCVVSGTEERDPDWPSETSGTVVTLDAPSSSDFTYIYTFDGYDYYGGQPSPTVFALAPHPVLGATFFDDSAPPVEDAISALGSFGFGQDGVLPCANLMGACCIAEACELRFEADCATLGGLFLGSDSSCATADCSPTPVVRKSWGAIKATQR